MATDSTRRRWVSAIKSIALLFALHPCSASSTSLDVQWVIFKPGHPLPGGCLERSMEDEGLGVEHLEKTLRIMNEYPELNYEIIGHADVDECQAADCELLSSRRAELVFAFFVEKGVHRSRLGTPRGVGAVAPFGLPGSPSNRAVEINIKD